MVAGLQRAGPLFLAALFVSLAWVQLAPTAESASVSPISGKLDRPVVGASAAYADGKYLVMGGRHADGTYSAQVLSYDPASARITHLGDLPQPASAVDTSPGRYSGAAVAVGNKIYYFGGAQLQQVDINGDGQKEALPKASRDVIEIDAITGTIRLLNDRLPQGTWGMAAAAANGYIYLFGGFSFDFADLPNVRRHDWVLRFDPNAPEPTTGTTAGQRFKTMPGRLPYTVQDAAAANLGRRILVMGGLADHNNDTNPCPTYTFYNSQTGRQDTRQITTCLTKRAVSFDPTTDQELVVGVVGELPYRAQFISAGVVGGKAYVPGALLSDGTAANSILEVTLDRAGVLQTKVLTPTLPRGGFGQGVATDGQTLTMFGGRWGNDRDLTDEIVRLDPRATAPWAPRSAASTEIPGGVRLTWEPPTYNGDSPVTGYRIYRAGGDAGEVRLTETTALQYDDTGVKPATEYTWRIVAVNAVGESEQSARVTRTGSLSVPGPVISFQAFAGNEHAILRWRAPAETGGSNITGYRVLRDGNLLTTLPPDAVEYTDRTVQNNKTYAYQVRAYNARGDGALSERQVIEPAPVPAPPAGVIAEVVAVNATSHVKITWTPGGTSAERYIVLRSTRAGAPGTVVAESLTDTTYVDTSVTRGQTYHYTVVSKNDVGRSPPSTEVSASLVRTPGAPADLVAVGLEGEIRLAWKAPTDTGDAPASALRYYVSRMGGGSSRSIIIKTEIEGQTYVDRQITPGQEYTYTVTTLNPMPSAASEPAAATGRVIQNKAPVAVLAVLPPIAVAGDPVELDASNSGDLDGSIKSYRYDFGDGTQPVTTDKPTVTHQFHKNGTYIATVTVKDDRGLESAPASAQIVIGETISDRVETGLGGAKSAAGARVPGSESPEIPFPAPVLVLLAVALLAIALRRRR